MKARQFLFFALLISLTGSCQQKQNSEVDALSNEIEVQNFVRKNFKKYSEFKVQKIQDFAKTDFDKQANIKLANDLGVNENFYKADFDKNGLTDILIIGDDFSCIGSGSSCSFTPIVVMNFGRGKYQAVNISPGFHSYFTPRLATINGNDILEIYRAEILDWQKSLVSKNPHKQILTYKFGDFIEYNSNANNFIPIEKIEFSTSGCFGTCPIFDLEINKNRTAKFVARHFNFNEKDNTFESDIDWGKNEGEYQTVIKEKDFKNLVVLLEYIDFPQLKDHYSVNWTDDQTVTLKITYGNKKVKIIEDYGASGTYGLKKVYKILYDFRKNQNWAETGQ